MTSYNFIIFFQRSIVSMHFWCLFLVLNLSITKTRLFKFTENFTTKNWKFSDKNSDIFHISAQNIAFGILNIIPSKNENFQIKILIFFYISAQNIDCGFSIEPPRRGSSNEYPQSMFLSRNKRNNVYHCKPQFYYIKVGFKRVKFI